MTNTLPDQRGDTVTEPLYKVLSADGKAVIIPLTDYYRVVRDKDGERVEYRPEPDLQWRAGYIHNTAAILAALHYREGE